ncbi:MAG: SIS domain-containing protein [Nocardioidaceae bacterium]
MHWRPSLPGSASRPRAVEKAADLVVASVRDDGVLQTFGSGHSEALAMELAGRAGGLVPSNRISLRDVVIFGGESTDVLSRGVLERDPAVAQQALRPGRPHTRQTCS